MKHTLYFMKQCLSILIISSMFLMLTACNSAETADTPKDDVFLQEYLASESESGWGYREYTYHIELSLRDMPYDNSGLLTIPSEINGKPVTHIQWHNYDYGQNYYAKTIILPENLLSIGESAFYDISPVNNIQIPNTLQECEGAFRNTTWYQELEDKFVIVGDGLLIKYNGTDEKVVIPEGVKHIDCAFTDKSKVQSVVFPETLESIGYNAFTNSGLTSVTIPGHVKKIGQGAFSLCDITDLILEDGVTTIGTSAFSNTNLSEVTIPASVDFISYNAFSRNEQLKTLTILGNPFYDLSDLQKSENITIRIPQNSKLKERLEKLDIEYETFTS